jgi:transglutaminase-like putative cysteine protease
MRLSVRHLTTYTYEAAPDRCALRLRLYPPGFDGQRVVNWQVSVNGQPIAPLLTSFTGDRESIWTCTGPTDTVEIAAEGDIETKDAAGVVKGLRDTSRPGIYLRSTPLTQSSPAIDAMAASAAGAKTLDKLHALMAAVRDAIDYKSGSTSTATTAAQALKAGAGVCQDHAHVFISAARAMKVPARYVVGYLLAQDENLTETHAWAEAYVPEIGWVGFDPANRLCPTDRYVRLGCGADSADAAPIRGNVSGSPGERLTASVDITQTQTQNQTQNGQTQSQSQQ